MILDMKRYGGKMIQKQPTWWAENGQPRQKKSILSRVTVSVQQRVTTPIPYMSIAKPSKSWRTSHRLQDSCNCSSSTPLNLSNTQKPVSRCSDTQDNRPSGTCSRVDINMITQLCFDYAVANAMFKHYCN